MKISHIVTCNASSKGLTTNLTKFSRLATIGSWSKTSLLVHSANTTVNYCENQSVYVFYMVFGDVAIVFFITYMLHNVLFHSIFKCATKIKSKYSATLLVYVIIYNDRQFIFEIRYFLLFIVMFQTKSFLL